jgi:NTP pyrophosphatase (non-canonical NTP hydrolase)
MNATEYQRLAARTLIDRPDFEITDKQIMIVWCAVGLAGETGEVMEHVKKGIFHQHGLDPEKMRKELGDVLWYVAGLCSTLGLDMGEVMTENVEKLRRRYPNGYSSADSIRRVDTEA